MQDFPVLYVTEMLTLQLPGGGGRLDSRPPKGFFSITFNWHKL